MTGLSLSTGVTDQCVSIDCAVFSDETIPGRVAGSPECRFNVVNDTFDREFTELLPPSARPDERAEFLFDRRVNCLVPVPSMVEMAVKPDR